MNAQQTLEKLDAQLFLIDDAAALLGCSRQRVHQLIELRGLAHLRKGRNTTLLLRSQIEQLAAEVPTETRGRKRKHSPALGKKKGRSKKRPTE